MFSRNLTCKPVSNYAVIKSLKYLCRQFHGSKTQFFSEEVTSSQVVSFYDDKVRHYAGKEIKPVNLAELMSFGKAPMTRESILRCAQYAHSELPVRLARRVTAFQNLPFIVGTNPHIKAIYKLYYDSFLTIVSFPEMKDESVGDEFSDMLKSLVDRHSDNIPTMARGFLECKRYMTTEGMTSFLDEMINARIGIRLIAEQCIALHEQQVSDLVGIINTRLRPAELVQQSANFVKDLCEANYGQCPDVTITGQIDTEFTYVNFHFAYIITELLKNSCRATVEHAKATGLRQLPPIEVTIAKGDTEVGIRVRDQGGGVDPKHMPRIFDYSYTTVPQDEDDSEGIFANITKAQVKGGMGGPIAGLGFGLPLARLYSKYFGGSMNLIPLDGYGCDLFLHLKRIDESPEEVKI